MSTTIYLDGHATTPLASEALAAMSPFWIEQAGNAHSPHVRGDGAHAAVERARGQIAGLVDADPQEVILTSGATESNNMVLLGVPRAAAGDQRRRIIVSAIEHRSVLAPAEQLAREGWDVAFAPVLGTGLLDLEALRGLLLEPTLLLSIGAANGEIGVVQPLAEIARLARAAGALVHSDVAQLAGKMPLSVLAADLDYASLSAHKLYGPMGVGALYVSAAAPRPRPLVYGGGQEGGLRPGSTPVPLVVGFGTAAELAVSRLVADSALARGLARRLLERLKSLGVRFRLNGSSEDRLPGSLSLAIDGLDGAELVSTLSPWLCFSAGSACSTGQIAPSHVLEAIGTSSDQIASSIRLYFGRYNTEAEADFAAAAISGVVEKRALATGGLRQ